MVQLKPVECEGPDPAVKTAKLCPQSFQRREHGGQERARSAGSGSSPQRGKPRAKPCSGVLQEDENVLGTREVTRFQPLHTPWDKREWELRKAEQLCVSWVAKRRDSRERRERGCQGFGGSTEFRPWRVLGARKVV